MHGRPPLSEMARWLSDTFSQPPEEFEAGKLGMVRALESKLGCSSDDAEELFDDLEREGFVRYAAEARSIGGTPGYWVIYPSPAENPDGALEEDVAIPSSESARPPR